ncbi:hypothetical protein [Fervidicoccus sp.]|uniref:hypothetical protein n=1 Tax=Fervidicoccus sp. TaxID=2060324 RepID=UPI003D0D69E6
MLVIVNTRQKRRMSFSAKKVARSVFVILPILAYGWFGLIAITFLMKVIFVYIQSENVEVVILRFVVFGAFVVFWLYSWWKFTVYYKKKIFVGQKLSSNIS